ncbi:ABC transporter ATP-binding protein [Mycetocola lacteus]|uniref:ABC-type quaternary amine transporter n=2 Tax=Mycetocola lacteus TaxID=76637 RepID=A0A3L7AHN4_9MICO|nr:ABC transporter ATP-binding protein [Mycetocola lacteus]
MMSDPTPTTQRSGVSVRFRAVTKEYGAQRALNGLDLDIQPGEFVALLGPSGCGKTTALRSLAGLETVTSGELLIDGEDVTRVPVNRRDLGMVFQSYSLFPNLNVIENVEFGLRTRKVPAAERTARAQEMLDRVGLGDFAERFAHQLSGGQQQRVALARALVTRPRVLLLDEPLSALDAKVRTQLRDEIRRIQLDLGITTVFVTHDQEEALAVADRIAVMNAGKIDQIGTPEELYRRPETGFVANFIGQSTLLTALVHEGRIALLGREIDLTDPLPEGALARVRVRPENLALESFEHGEGEPGAVVTTSFLGSLRRTTVHLDSGLSIVVQHSAEDTPEVESRVRVRLLQDMVTAHVD